MREVPLYPLPSRPGAFSPPFTPKITQGYLAHEKQPTQGPYGSTKPRALCWSSGRRLFLMGEVSLYFTRLSLSLSFATKATLPSI